MARATFGFIVYIGSQVEFGDRIVDVSVKNMPKDKKVATAKVAWVLDQLAENRRNAKLIAFKPNKNVEGVTFVIHRDRQCPGDCPRV